MKRTDNVVRSFKSGRGRLASSDSNFDEHRFLDDERAGKLSLRGDGDENDVGDDDDENYDDPYISSELGLSRPDPARGLTISPLPIRNGLNISWSSPTNSSVPASFFIVEYRSEDSIGWQAGKPLLWSALTDRLVHRRWTTIYDVRPGFRYDFRVFAFSAFNTFR